MQTDRCVCESESVRIDPLYVIPYPLYLRVTLGGTFIIYVPTNVNLTREATLSWLAISRSTVRLDPRGMHPKGGRVRLRQSRRARFPHRSVLCTSV